LQSLGSLGGCGGGDIAEVGDATWTHAFTPPTSWSTPGGDFDPVASASTSVGFTGTYQWTSSQMETDVQTWLDTPGQNHGWILIGNEASQQTAKRFDTRENGSSSNQPTLEVEFTPPPGALACCLDDGSCAVTADAPGCTALGGIDQGMGSTCDPNTCPQLAGACCVQSGMCSEVTQVECMALPGGSYQGDATTCSPQLCPVIPTPWLDELPRPRVAVPITGSAGGAAHYEIRMQEFQQQLHSELPPTTLWGYADGGGPVYPGPTIEARADELVTVEWINDLRTTGGDLRTAHILPVDSCIHGAEADDPRTVVHLHGAHTAAEWDGHPEDTILPGESDVYQYPNGQLPTTLWYHDHALGITRLNVYLGLAAFYLIRDDLEDGLGLPSGEFEIPIVIQDRTFNADGSLFYPEDWQDRFFGNTMVVNGKVWPYLPVKQGKYRFRLLNGSNTRTLTLTLGDPLSPIPFTKIGTDGGLLDQPIQITSLTLGPAERADVIMDFQAGSAGTEIILTNSAPAPFPNGVQDLPNVLKFVVQGQPGFTGAIPSTLRPFEQIPEMEAVQQRDFQLRRGSNATCAGGSDWVIESEDGGQAWDELSELPRIGTTEIWRFINRSGMEHPMHMHLVQFQVLDFQDYDVDPGDGSIIPVGLPAPPTPNQRGWRDTVGVPRQKMTRVIARFEDFLGTFVYHCHILEHEDHEMMRQFEVVSECGDDILWPDLEECDDGNNVNGDGCNDMCEIEDLLSLVGLPQGGAVSMTIAGVPISVDTSLGETPASVAQALADAINAEAIPGVTANAVGNVLAVNATIANLAITDPGLATPPVITTGLETFEAYAPQSDPTAVTDADGDVVATVGEALASSTGVAAGGLDQVWTLDSAPGVPEAPDGLVMIGDLPGMGPATPGGPFAIYFQAPRDLAGGSVRTRLRAATGNGAARARVLLSDDAGNEIASAQAPLGASFSEATLAVPADFTNLVAGSSFDFGSVTGLAVELLSPSNPAPAYRFEIDEVEVIPEPGLSALALTALGVLAGLAARRRRGG